MFNKKLSPEEYNEWIVCNGYSKQIPVKGQIEGMKITENGRNIYVFRANVYKNPNYCRDIPATVFYADVELKDETWPLFQHFVRLIVDPLIYLRTLSLYSTKGVMLLAGAMNPERGRLQCKHLNIFSCCTQKLIVWIKMTH